MKKNRTAVGFVGGLLAIAVSSAGAIAQDFLPYEGKNTIQEGEGGTKKVVDGVDFWADGAPPRPFKLLGYISDRRHKTGLIGMFRMSTLESDVAKLAKDNGGDAVILVASEAEDVGSIGNTFGRAQGNANTIGNSTTMNATGSSTNVTSRVQKQQSKYAVVKYVEREKARASEAPAPASSGDWPSESQKEMPTPNTPAAK